MKNSFGSSLSVSIFGESHGSAIGALIDGIAPGIKIDEDYINKCLDQRRPYGKISTQRREADNWQILSGVFNGYTTGTPFALTIPNENTKSCDYKGLLDTPRPGHADYTAECKYHGFQDYRGGGHFSGRITAALVLAGSIIRYALEKKGIKIGTHIERLAGIPDRSIKEDDIDTINGKLFPVLDDKAEKSMVDAIAERPHLLLCSSLHLSESKEKQYH